MKKAQFIKVISWVLVIVCMAVIFALSAETGSESEATSDNVMVFFGIGLNVDLVRTAAHCIEFAGLAVLVFNAFYWSFGKFRPYISFAVSALYAVSDEVHQLFVEGRSFQIKDIFIDSVGAFAGVLFAMLIGVLILKRRRSE